MTRFPHKLEAMMRRATTVLALVCALSLGAPIVAAAASSDTPSAAISDCNAHGTLTAHYSASTLRAALAQMPSDVKEYTDCYDVIERQLFAELGKSASGTVTPPASSSSSSFPTWLIIVIVVLALAAITFGAIAVRRRSGGPGGPGAGDAGAGDAGAGGPGAGGGPGDVAGGPGGSGEPGGPAGPPPAT
jgi:hypothetical protein